MLNCDYITKEDVKGHNPNQPELPDHSNKILIVEGSDLKKQMQITQSDKS